VLRGFAILDIGRCGRSRGPQKHRITEDEANRFYDNAKFWRHGLPREPLKGDAMTIEEAEVFIRKTVTKFALEETAKA
jgi:hypothetical protein